MRLPGRDLVTVHKHRMALGGRFRIQAVPGISSIMVPGTVSGWTAKLSKLHGTLRSAGSGWDAVLGLQQHCGC